VFQIRRQRLGPRSHQHSGRSRSFRGLLGMVRANASLARRTIAALRHIAGDDRPDWRDIRHILLMPMDLFQLSPHFGQPCNRACFVRLTCSGVGFSRRRNTPCPAFRPGSGALPPASAEQTASLGVCLPASRLHSLPAVSPTASAIAYCPPAVAGEWHAPHQFHFQFSDLLVFAARLCRSLLVGSAHTIKSTILARLRIESFGLISPCFLTLFTLTCTL